MPQNRFIYVGVLLIAAVALMWLTSYILQFVHWILPFGGGLGAVFIVIGILGEARKEKRAKAALSSRQDGAALGEAEKV